MPHFWCGVMKFSITSGLPLLRSPRIARVVFRSTGGRYTRQAFAEAQHPFVVLVELLAPG